MSFCLYVFRNRCMSELSYYLCCFLLILYFLELLYVRFNSQGFCDFLEMPPIYIASRLFYNLREFGNELLRFTCEW